MQLLQFYLHFVKILLLLLFKAIRNNNFQEGNGLLVWIERCQTWLYRGVKRAAPLIKKVLLAALIIAYHVYLCKKLLKIKLIWQGKKVQHFQIKLLQRLTLILILIYYLLSNFFAWFYPPANIICV